MSASFASLLTLGTHLPSCCWCHYKENCHSWLTTLLQIASVEIWLGCFAFNILRKRPKFRLQIRNGFQWHSLSLIWRLQLYWHQVSGALCSCQLSTSGSYLLFHIESPKNPRLLTSYPKELCKQAWISFQVQALWHSSWLSRKLLYNFESHPLPLGLLYHNRLSLLRDVILL